MSLRKKLQLTWSGKVYSLLVTMEVIDRVEAQVNIGALLAQQNSGEIRFGQVAKLLSVLMNEAGTPLAKDEKRVYLSQEEVFEGMFSGVDIDAKDLAPLLGEIFAAFFPTPKKKDIATKKPTTKKRQKKAILGTKSTP